MTWIPHKYAGARRSAISFLRKQIPSFFEDRVDVFVERLERLVKSGRAPYRALPMLEDRSSDLLPLWHLRQRHHPLELVAECLRVLVVGERGILPRRSARRKIARQVIKSHLHF